MKAIAKKIVEKATGEKYTSKTAMAKHEKSETKATQKKEIKGAVKGAIKGAVKGAVKGAMKASPAKMKKC
jgi:hypothetical protein